MRPVPVLLQEAWGTLPLPEGPEQILEFDCKCFAPGLTFFAMKIAVGSDHAGFHLKEKVVAWLRGKGVDVEDMGTHSAARCDYPDFAKRVADHVAAGQAERGILVCGSGIGMSITANKVAGVRAAECFNAVSAQLSRAHNDANVLCLGERLVDESTARQIVETWLTTPFEGGRHAQRVEKIRKLERENFKNIRPGVCTEQ